MKIEINIKKSDWKKLNKVAKKLRKKSGYKVINAEKIANYLIKDYIKNGIH